MFFGDYPTQTAPVGWPGGRILNSTEGPGRLRTVAVSNPGAGADWSLTVPTNGQWRISSLNAQLAIANAGVARIVRIQILGAGGQLVWQSAAQQTGAINTTVQVSAAPGQVTTVVDTTTLNIAIPGLTLMNGTHVIRTSTSNINAGDQWSNIAVQVEEWLQVG